MTAGFSPRLQMGSFGEAILTLCPRDMVRKQFVPSLFQARCSLNTSVDLLMSPSAAAAAAAASSSPHSSLNVSHSLSLRFSSHLSLCLQLNDPLESHFLPSPPSRPPVSFKSHFIPLHSPHVLSSLFSSPFLPNVPRIKMVQSVFLARDRD